MVLWGHSGERSSFAEICAASICASLWLLQAEFFQMQMIWVISPRQPLLFCRPVLKKGPVAALGWEARGTGTASPTPTSGGAGLSGCCLGFEFPSTKFTPNN